MDQALMMVEPASVWPQQLLQTPLLQLLLDEIDYGVLLLDPQQRPCLANRAALSCLEAASALCLQQGRVSAAGLQDRLLLAAAVQAALSKHLRRLLVVGQGDLRIGVAVIPIHAGAGDDERSHVLLLLSRRHLCEDLSAHGFARERGLTGAEADVLKALCRGHDPGEIAADHQVAMSTVRTQISSIRQKTNSASIRDLVHLVARLPPIRPLHV